MFFGIVVKNLPFLFVREVIASLAEDNAEQFFVRRMERYCKDFLRIKCRHSAKGYEAKEKSKCEEGGTEASCAKPNHDGISARRVR
jgi:hypothetical protein